MSKLKNFTVYLLITELQNRTPDSVYPYKIKYDKAIKGLRKTGLIMFDNNNNYLIVMCN